MVNNSFINLNKINFKDKKFMFNAIKDSKKMTNFGSSRNTFLHVLKSISFLSNNSKNYNEYKFNLELLKKVNHYTIEDFVNFLSTNKTFNELTDKENTFLIKQENNEYGSNNIILTSITRNNRKLKQIIKCEDDINEKGDVSAVYIDDFVGTGNTAKEILKGEYKEKIIICYYIIKETKLSLEESGYKVYYYRFANIVDDEIQEVYKTMYSEPSEFNKKYALNTLISENYRSPNNNFQWIYYYRQNKWNNFLNIRNNKYLPKLNNLSINEKNNEFYFKDIHNSICENKHKKRLSSLGFITKEERRNLFDEVISNYDVEHIYAELNDGSYEAAARIIANELNYLFEQQKETNT